VCACVRVCHVSLTCVCVHVCVCVSIDDVLNSKDAFKLV